MSIGSSLSNAVSGLNAVTRAAEVISSNIANANTEGYGRRDLVLGARLGGGVRVDAITRNVNQAAISDRRLAESASGQASTVVDFYKSIETVLGIPGQDSSLATQISNFESSLIAAVAIPESGANLSAVLSSAQQVVSSINTASDAVQSERMRADAQIFNQVNSINSALQNVADLNSDIRRQMAVGGDVAGLMDQRQIQIDGISELIPLRELPRDFGAIALVTENGAVLLDDRAAVLNFQPTPVITPDMTLASGALSGLTIEGAASSLGNTEHAIAGGALAASFNVRDTLAVEAQVQLDAVARNLIERFSGPTVDSTLAVDQAGLFTDAGVDFDSLNELNLASRLRINDAVNPEEGGDISKLRDGINSVTAGPVGDNQVLANLRDALTGPLPAATGNFSTGGSFSVLTTDLISQFSSQRLDSEAKLAHSSSRMAALVDLEHSNGVSTDDELQKLLIVERAYAANAKIIQTVDEMIQSLLRI